MFDKVKEVGMKLWGVMWLRYLGCFVLGLAVAQMMLGG